MKVTALGFVMAICAWGGYFYGNGFYLLALAEAHGWSVTRLSSAITIGFASCIPASIVVGWVFDLYAARWGPCAVVCYGALAMASGIAALAHVDSVLELYAAYALMGSAYPALAAPAISAILNQRVRERYGLALSIALTGASVGGALAAPSLVWASDRFGLTGALSAIAVLIVALLVPLALWILRPVVVHTASRSNKATSPGRSHGVSSALAGATFWRIWIAALLSLAAQVGFLAHQLSVLTALLEPANAALLVSATAIASAIGRFLVAGLSTRIELHVLAALTYATMAIGIAIVALADTATIAIVGCLLTGAFVGAVVLLPPLLCGSCFAPAIYGRVYGFIAIGVYSGGALGPSVAGVLRDAFARAGPAMLCLAGLSLTAAIVVLRLSASRHRPATR